MKLLEENKIDNKRPRDMDNEEFLRYQAISYKFYNGDGHFIQLAMS